MAKDPAFLFYSSDFLVGTMTMSMEDRGKYITLLATMHQKGRLDEKTIRLLVGLVSEDLASKFLVDNDGFWYNERLEEEAEKRRNFVASRRRNAQKGGRPRGSKTKKKKGSTPKNHMDMHMDNHMEDENVNDNIDKEEGSGEEIIEQVYDQIIPFFKDFEPDKSQVENWKTTIDRLIRIDKVPPPVIVLITETARKNDFWSKNFLSLTKLRKKNREGVPYWKVFAALHKSENQDSKKQERIKANLSD